MIVSAVSRVGGICSSERLQIFAPKVVVSVKRSAISQRFGHRLIIWGPIFLVGGGFAGSVCFFSQTKASVDAGAAPNVCDAYACERKRLPLSAGHPNSVKA
jgi:hypothetical protein